MSLPSETPAKSQAILLLFEYGDGEETVKALASADDDIPYLGTNYESEPRVEVEVPKMAGTLKQKDAEISLPLEDEGFSDLVSNGEPHSPVKCTVMERLVAGTEETVRFLFRGKLARAFRNAKGRRGRVKLEVGGPKGELDVRLGISIAHACRWTHGDENSSPCGIDLSAYRQTGTIIAVDGPEVWITGLDYSWWTDLHGKWWHRGYLEIDGLRLTVRDWAQGDETRFLLVRDPPASWLNASVTATPGCDKLVETCRGRWDNEENCSCIGIAMPAYNPTLEDPG